MLKVLPLTFQGLALAATGDRPQVEAAPGLGAALSSPPGGDAAESFSVSLLGLHPRLPELLAGIISDHTPAACGGAEERARVVGLAYATLSRLASCSNVVANYAAASPALARVVFAALQAGDAELVLRIAEYLRNVVTGPAKRCSDGQLPQAGVDRGLARSSSLRKLLPDAALPALARGMCVLGDGEECAAMGCMLAGLLEQLSVERDEAATALYSDAAWRAALISTLESRLVQWFACLADRPALGGGLLAKCTVNDTPEMAILERLCRTAPSGDDKALIVRDSLQAVIAARPGGGIGVGALFGSLLEQLSCLNTAMCDDCIAKSRRHSAVSRDTEARADNVTHSAGKTGGAPAAEPQQARCSVCGEAQGPDGQRPHLCSGCRKPGLRYCSKACQREHWKGGHREECKALQKDRAVRSAAQGKQE